MNIIDGQLDDDISLGEWIYMNCKTGDRLVVTIMTDTRQIALANLRRDVGVYSAPLFQRDFEASTPRAAPSKTPPKAKPG